MSKFSKTDYSNLDIKIGDDYRITSNGICFTVNERRFVDPTKSPHWKKLKEKGTSSEIKESWTEEGYFGSIEGAIRHIVKRKTLLSNAQSVQELLEEVRLTKAEIDKAFEV